MSNHHIIIDGQQIPLKMRRNARAKRIVMRLSKDGQAVNLTLPRRCSERKAAAFAKTQSDWLSKQLAKRPEAIAFEPDMKLQILGDELYIYHHNGRLTKREDENIYVGGDIAFFPRRLTDYIKKEARIKFSDMANELADEVGVTLAGLRLRDTSSRWGSCSRDRRINLSWRLALAPLDIARYVIAHEVAHLEHFDHSPAFWAVVEKLHPDWQSARKWLHENGALLHSYG